MNIWLIYPYGSIPGEGLRPDRPGMVGTALAKAGHEVTWWASNIEHRSKTVRSGEWKDIEVAPNFTLRLVPTSSYTKNISIKRILYEYNYGKQIKLLAHKYSSPDLIIIGEPALFFNKFIIKIIKGSDTKLLLDRLDLWPELFHMILPKPVNRLGSLIFSPLYLNRRSLFKQAHAIIACSEEYLRMALAINSNVPKELTDTVYFGIDLDEQRGTMNKTIGLPPPLQDITRKEGELWAIYASTLGHNYDLKTLLNAAKILSEKKANIKILIAGTGPLKDYIVSYINNNDLKQIVYIGNPDSDTMASIFTYCDIGLSMYLQSSTVSMPIKAFHYFAAGLPIVNSLKGDLSMFIKTHQAGMNYEAEDPISLANTLEILANDPIKLKSMAENSYKLASLFDIKVQYAKLVELVNRLAV